jgi:predicted outer membrane repeat protein
VSVFFFTGDSTRTVSLSGLTIANGRYSAITTNNIHTAAHLILDQMTFRNNSGTSHGNAVTTQGKLTVSNSLFEANTGSSYGGAISTAFGDVSIRGSIFRNNASSEQDGGALAIQGVSKAVTLTIQQCSFIGNSAYRYGGAIDLDSRVNATITQSQFRSNLTLQSSGYPSADGGAIHSAGQLAVDRSAFFNNVAAGSGGGIATIGKLDVTNSTFYENRAVSANALAFDKNDATGSLTHVTLYDSLTTGTQVSVVDNITIKNSLFATPGKVSCEVVFQANPANTHNLANDATCKAGFSVVTLAQMNLKLKNDYLLPLAGSLALDSGLNEACPATDQRGWTRPVDGDGAGGAVCDIGAIEASVSFNELFIPMLRR